MRRRPSANEIESRTDNPSYIGLTSLMGTMGGRRMVTATMAKTMDMDMEMDTEKPSVSQHMSYTLGWTTCTIYFWA